LAVKRKKQHEEQITKLQQQQSNLQTMIDQIDDSMMVADVLETKKTFLASMKDIQQGM
jgi:phage shock protein A